MAHKTSTWSLQIAQIALPGQVNLSKDSSAWLSIEISSFSVVRHNFYFAHIYIEPDGAGFVILLRTLSLNVNLSVRGQSFVWSKFEVLVAERPPDASGLMLFKILYISISVYADIMHPWDTPGFASKLSL